MGAPKIADMHAEPSTAPAPAAERRTAQVLRRELDHSREAWGEILRVSCESAGVSASETFPALPAALLGASPSSSAAPAINDLESAGPTSSDDDPQEFPVVCAASAGSNPAGDAEGGTTSAGESGEDEPPSDDDGDDIVATFRRAAAAARAVAARHGGDEGAVLSLLAIELVGELEDTAARVRGAA